jgi:hypothetical protein
MKTSESNAQSEFFPTTGELLEACVVENEARGPDGITIERDLNGSVSPTSGDGEPETSHEFFRHTEGEDLKCKVLDEQGKRIPIRVKQIILFTG